MAAIGRAAPKAAWRLGVSRDLQALRADLEEQRRFRVKQLEDLDSIQREASTRSADDARNQVTFALRAAAAALVDIDAALDRLWRSCYGLCLGCGAAISLERLQALPMVRLCMSCQRVRETSCNGPSGQRHPLTESRQHL